VKSMAPPPNDPVDPFLVEFAVETAMDAGRLTLEWFATNSLAVDHKSDGTPVTAADLAAETLIRDRIASRFPNDAIIGEEFPNTTGTSDRTWVIDPIDGTKAFTHGVPLYSNLIAMIDRSGPAVGVINLPALDEVVAAGRSLGATHNGQSCRVSQHDRLTSAYVCTSGTGYWPRAALNRVLDSGCVLRTWGDAYGYALVATGRAEAMIDPQAYPWDIAPMAVIIPEAGGAFTNTSGQPDWRGGSGVATNGHLHQQVLDLLVIDPPRGVL